MDQDKKKNPRETSSREPFLVPIELLRVNEDSVNMDKFSENISYIYVFKCKDKSCMLEFAVFSWWENWEETHKPYCPECGKQDTVCLRATKRNRPIYAIVHDSNLGNEQ